MTPTKYTRTRQGWALTVVQNGVAECDLILDRERAPQQWEQHTVDRFAPSSVADRARFVDGLEADARPIVDALLREAAALNAQRVAFATTGEPRASDDDEASDPVVAQYNREHAAVWVPNGLAIVSHTEGLDGRADYDLCSEAVFKARLRPWKKDVTRWLDSPERREYRKGLVFEPGVDVPGAFNLWRGFGVAADPAPGPEQRCARFLEHVFENVCQRDAGLFVWVIGWLAQMVQQPRVKLGTSLFLRGRQGSGKTVVGRAMRRILGRRHYFLANDPRFVVGRFNAHLENVLLLHADEAFFAGDPTAVGRLKDLITDDQQTIERKGMEPVTVSNYLRLLGTTNSDWVIPAAEDERRFAVLDVGDRRLQDRTYFGAIEDELDAGGAAALLAHLLAFDVTSANLRAIPHTDALAEQKVRSLSPEGAWWLDLLQAGELPPDRFGEPGVCEADVLTAHYVEHAKSRGVQRRSAGMVLGHFLHRTAPGMRRTRRVLVCNGERQRPWVYVFPDLDTCRSHAPGGVRVWDDPGADWSAGERDGGAA